MTSRAQRVAGWRRPLAVAGIALLLLGNHALAQNLGASPQTNVAVQGETGGMFKLAEMALASQVKGQMEQNFARLKKELES